ncbi:MAG: hypothetical protein JWM21_1673 [Acidobacteria bacterium]|nr:hypothetical protein [Acidobacteriota bacterium]
MDSVIFRTFLFGLLTLALSGISPAVLAKGDLSPKQARKLISGMPGFDLKTNNVRVSLLRPVDDSTIEAQAEIATAFRFEKNQTGQWRIAEFRTGQELWQSIELVTHALKVAANAGGCDGIDPSTPAQQISDPSNKRARCLVAELLGVQLPSDAVRIRTISPPAVPFGSKTSALIEAQVEAEFRFKKDPKGSWRVAGVRTGTRAWMDPQAILSAVNNEKVNGARSELEIIAKALEDFRGQRGFYVESKSEAVLIDFLSPRYLTPVIRLDPWRRPYLYEGTRDQFTLRSSGPDGKENTGDDIVVSKPRA